MASKCDQCFYALMDKELEAPCASCVGYSNFVKGDLYMTSHDAQPLQEAIDEWFGKTNGITADDFLDYDSVNKPKHYMLFEKEGIQVRDVIEKLVKKLDHHGYSGMFIADYVQMMQYLMRFMEKNGKEDLEKSLWYLPKLIEAYESDL
jgi:Protein of unknwon function (DUF3310)